MEALSRLMEKAVEGRCFLGFRVGGSTGSTLMVLNLRFADDTLIFCGVDPEQIWYLKCVIVWFHAVSSLKIYRGNSKLVLVGLVQNFVDLADNWDGKWRCFH